jgi:hypothetical protein
MEDDRSPDARLLVGFVASTVFEREELEHRFVDAFAE